MGMLEKREAAIEKARLEREVKEQLKKEEVARKREKESKTLDAAIEYLKANQQATNAEVCYYVGCSPRTAAMARGKLRSIGLDVRANADRVNAKKVTEAVNDAALVAEDPSLEVENAGDLINAINTEIGGDISEDASPEEMRSILTRILRNRALDPRVRVLAIAQKQKLDFETQDRDSLGPGKPLTREDALTRLTLLITACGPDLLQDAITRAFNQKEPDAEL